MSIPKEKLKEYGEELLVIADFLQILQLKQIIELLLDDTDFEEKRNIEKAVETANKWIKNNIERFTSYNGEEKDYLTTLLLDDNEFLLESVENQVIEGITNSLKSIKLKIETYVNEKGTEMSKYQIKRYFPDDEKEIFTKLFEYSYKLPKILKNIMNEYKK